MPAALCRSLKQLENEPKFLLHLPHSGKCYEPDPYIVAVSVASQVNRCTHMRDSAVQHNVPLVIVKHAFRYTTQRFAALLPIADAVDPDTVLLNVDCYDILFLASGDEILKRYRMFGRKYVIGAEKGAFPDHGHTLVKAYKLQGDGTPHCQGSSLKYANCGAFATTMAGMREMMEWMARKYPNSRCLCNYLKSEECSQRTTLANDQACMHRFVMAHWNQTAMDCGILIMNLFRTRCTALQYKVISPVDAVKLEVGLVITNDPIQQGGLVLHASGKSKQKLDELRCCANKLANQNELTTSSRATPNQPQLVDGCCCQPSKHKAKT